jgi:hypothetical protein
MVAGLTDPPPAADAHVDFDLGLGLRARVALALTDTDARQSEGRFERLNALLSGLAALPDPRRQSDLDVRLADVAVAWSVFRHFYPYWPETGVEWDGRLLGRLTDARDATTRAEHGDVLRRLVADADDGHGNVNDPTLRDERARLPIGVALLDGQVVVTASDAPDRISVGTVIRSIDGVVATGCVQSQMDLVSGTIQWRTARAMLDMLVGSKGDSAVLGVSDGEHEHTITLRYESSTPALDPRPSPVTEIEPAVWYLDLTRALWADVEPTLEKLATAKGMVVDLRGYPTDAGSKLLDHLIDAPERDRWMHIARISGPFGQIAGWRDLGWDLSPKAPHIGGTVVFLTDGRAISYAESVMGYVADHELATIIGSTTAGTNGNVATAELPGGFVMRFTGMRVTRHDGHSPFHLAGVRPDIAVAPTVRGLRRGHDEVLDRALSFIHSRAAEP